MMTLRWAERVWQPSAARRSGAVPNGEGVASGSATAINIFCHNRAKIFKKIAIFS